MSVGQQKVEFGNLEEKWLHGEVRRQQPLGPVCVRVEIRQGDVTLIFATRACAGGGGVRDYNRQEQGVIQRWRELGLDADSWTSGNLLAFLKSLRSL